MTSVTAAQPRSSRAAAWCLLLCLWVTCVLAARKIYDPLGVFCGEESCYDVLGVEKTATARQLKSAYRRLAAVNHPDKNKAANATVVFRKIAKAYEVLENNKSRESFDYYLRNPTDYFKVSGEHYYRALPKANVFVVVTGLLLLLSVFLHVVKQNKHDRAKRFLLDRVLNGKTEQNGGTRQTMQLFAQAEEKYKEHKLNAQVSGAAAAAAAVASPNNSGGSGGALNKLDKKIMKQAAKNKSISVNRSTMIADKDFQDIVAKLIAEVKIEGDYAKPLLKDLFVLQVALSPYFFYLWLVKYHRRYISKTPLSIEEKTEMAIEAIGIATWDELTAIQRTQAIDQSVWISDNYDKWVFERDKLLKKQGKREEEEWSMD